MKKTAWAVFFGFFSLYLWTMPPSLAPYRDAGEFAVSAASLGVSHPPSYPLYVLLAHPFATAGAANPAYLVGVLSALAAAAAAAVVFLAAAASWGIWPGLAAALLIGTNATFWTVAGVQEMYSLTMLNAAVLLLAALRLRGKFSAGGLYGGAFLFGLFLGNRTDILLWVPGLLVLAAPPGLLKAPWRDKAALAVKAAAFGLLGLSVYLYLPLRSLQGPWLDWNHPGNLHNFIGSLTRRGYGGTLDLLSKNYAAGEMFLPNLKVYAVHLWRNAGPAGLLLALLGAAASTRSDARRAAGTGLLYLASGPVFLFLANLPPNPHAMAIVDPHYLLSDLILALWAAEGAALLIGASASGALPPRNPAEASTGGTGLPFTQRSPVRDRVRSPSVRRLVGGLILAAALSAPVLTGRWTEMNRRRDLSCADFAGNALRSTPPGAILVAKKDVQIFSLWYASRVSGLRPDIEIVAQGLAHSPWYRDSFERERRPVRLGFLRTAEDWRRFVADNPRPVFATMDADLPEGGPRATASGTVLALSSAAAPSARPWEFLILRGETRYERRPDFFSADLLESYAAARQTLGARLLAEGDEDGARRSLLFAGALKRRLPEVYAHLAYLHFKAGRLAPAALAYEYCDLLYEETLALTREYFSLPEVTRRIARAAADARLNLGVVYEKTGRPAEAERMYRKALIADPGSARAHFNLAVIYWNSDLAAAVRELEAAVSADPGYEAARKYLAVARARLAK